MIKWIVFDAFGVVYPVRDDTNDLLVPFIKKIKPGISREFINASYRKTSLGELSSKEFWRQMGIEEAAVEKEYLDSCLKIDNDFIKNAGKLKSRFKLAMLSNDISEWSLYLRKKFGIDKIIDRFFISGDMKLRKPDERIYKTMLDAVREKGNACVFIDDRKENLLSAEKLGFKTIRFTRENDFLWKNEIKSFNELESVLEKWESHYDKYNFIKD